MPNPFFFFLKKDHEVKKLTSHPETAHARELQLLVDSGDNTGYRKKEAEYRDIGEQFRLTKGHVYEMKDEGETVKIQIALQVKGGSLTWYFWAPGAMDQYSQEFRDELYDAAALAHKQVKNGCDYYYRGSNAVHIKLMHHIESESDHNHNHYRLLTGMHYTPEDFRQHLEALGRSEIHDKFFEKDEIEELCERYARFYLDWTAKVDGQPSKEEEYFASRSQQLVPADLVELDLFGGMQEPCRLSISELQADYESARQKIELALNTGEEELLVNAVNKLKREYEELLEHRRTAGSRGLKSVLASTRQVEGSKNPVVESVMSMDDSRGRKEVADIPEWAASVIKAVDLYKKILLDNAERRLVKNSSILLALEEAEASSTINVQGETSSASPIKANKSPPGGKQREFVRVTGERIEGQSANVEGLTFFASSTKEKKAEKAELDKADINQSDLPKSGNNAV